MFERGNFGLAKPVFAFACANKDGFLFISCRHLRGEGLRLSLSLSTQQTQTSRKANIFSGNRSEGARDQKDFEAACLHWGKREKYIHLIYLFFGCTARVNLSASLPSISHTCPDVKNIPPPPHPLGQF